MSAPVGNARRPEAAPALVLGVALAGFVDGIVLHQLLEWHHLLSAVDADPRANMIADGLFHLGALLAGAIAVVLFWRRREAIAADGTPRALAGWLLVGFGGFNLAEGLIDHHILAIHHVRGDVADPWIWDWAFLAINLVILGVGAALAHDGARGRARAAIGPAAGRMRR